MKNEVILRRVKSWKSNTLRKKIREDKTKTNKKSQKISLWCDLITTILAVFLFHYLAGIIENTQLYIVVSVLFCGLFLVINNIVYYFIATLIL